MKIAAFILLIFSLQLSAHTKAQEQITLNEKGASLLKIFAEIQRQAGYNFFFSEEMLRDSKPVDIAVAKASIKEVLDICFRNQPFTYSITKNIITIIPKKNQKIDEENATQNALIDVSGKVVDKDGNAVAGASVVVKGTVRTAVTNGKGEFFFKDIDKNAILLVTSVGFQDVDVRINNRSTVTVMLDVKIESMNEVQVIAYGQTTKRLNTGNVSSLKSTDIEKQPVNNPMLALAGRIPGMEITQISGIAGASVHIQIRGQNSISNGNDPLYIIDGVPYSSRNLPGLSHVFGNTDLNPGSPFSYINPSDIESIDVLKDADATAIYGSRGANGVVLITTKIGKAGDLKLDINAQSGWGKVNRKIDVLDTRQYLDMRYEAFRNDGLPPKPNDYDLTLWDTTRNTDWQEELIGGSAAFNDIQGSLLGGNVNIQYLLSAGYHKETTVFPGDFNDQKGFAHFNLNNISPNKKFKLSFSGVYSVDNNQLLADDLTEQAVKTAPNAPSLYNDDGSINWAPNNAGVSTWPDRNPAALTLLGFKIRTNNLVSNATMSYQLLKGLLLKSSFGYTYMQTDEVQKIPLAYQDPATWATSERRSRFANNTIRSWIIEPQITYNAKIFKGELSLLAGATIQKNNNSGQRLLASGFNSDLVLEDIKSATTVTVISSVNSIYKYNAIFGRINYNLQDKYLINLTARRDGTSRFGPANRFHNFGAIGMGWVFSSESLFKELAFVSFGKLRGSYGITGNDQVGDYSYLDLYTPVNVGVAYLGVNGISPSRIYTPDLAWEDTKKMEAGLELGFFRDRVFLSASFYKNRSSNQLIDYILPAIAGFPSVKKNLDAVVQNKGWEFLFKATVIKHKNFEWTTAINASINRNKLVSGSKGLSAFYLRKIGLPLSSRFVYRFLGVDPITGMYQVADAKGTPTLDPVATDATVLIDFNPKYYGGVTTNISYKWFQLDFLIQFVKRPQAPIYLYNFIPGTFTSTLGANQPVTALDHWRRPGDVSNIQKLTSNLSGFKAWNNAQQSDQLYGDASFLRLKNVSLSYLLPVDWIKKLHLKSGRIFIQGQNLLTKTNYKGLDPETFTTINLPLLRVITAGLKLSL